MKHAATLLLALWAVGANAASTAESGFFPELSGPLFEYCRKVETSGLLKEELGFLFEQCRQAHSDDAQLAREAMVPGAYLMSLRKLDKLHHKSLWELHLLLRSSIERDDVALFQRIEALEERRIFEMNGLLPYVIAFTQRHDIALPYFINPNVKTTPFRHDWNPGPLAKASPAK